MEPHPVSRTKTWSPKPRPEWVSRINEEGRHLDIKSIVPLDENSLLTCAKANTGLGDFGVDDGWYEAFKILIDSLDNEAELNLMGRIMTRWDILMYLQARLSIAGAFTKHPEINDIEIKDPIMVIGQGRSGTSALINMLSMDPDVGTVKHRDVFFPCLGLYPEDGNPEDIDRSTTLMNPVIPEFNQMHEFKGGMPTEKLHTHCVTFRALWFDCFGGQAPTYQAYLQQQPVKPLYEYEKRLLKLLQWQRPCTRWVMKSPQAVMHIPVLLQVYPDIHFAWTHRDPIKALSSVVNLIGTLFWSRSDKPFLGNTLELYTNADLSAAMLNQPIEWLESGILSPKQLFNIQYADLTSDPLTVIQDIYRYFDLDISADGIAAIKRYIDGNPRSDRPVHRYSTGSQEHIAHERHVYKKYQDYFNVPNEI